MHVGFRSKGPLTLQSDHRSRQGARKTGCNCSTNSIKSYGIVRKKSVQVLSLAPGHRSMETFHVLNPGLTDQLHLHNTLESCQTRSFFFLVHIGQSVLRRRRTSPVCFDSFGSTRCVCPPTVPADRLGGEGYTRVLTEEQDRN